MEGIRKQIYMKFQEVSNTLKETTLQFNKLHQEFENMSRSWAASEVAIRGSAPLSQYAAAEQSASLRKGKEMVESKGKELEVKKEEKDRLIYKLRLLENSNKLWEEVNSIEAKLSISRRNAPTISREEANEKEDDARIEMRLIQTKYDKLKKDANDAEEKALKLIRERPEIDIETLKRNSAFALQNRNAYVIAKRKLKSLESIRNSYNIRHDQKRIAMSPQLRSLTLGKVFTGIRRKLNEKYYYNPHDIRKAQEYMRSEGRIPEAEALELLEKITIQMNETKRELDSAISFHNALLDQKNKFNNIELLEEQLMKMTEDANKASIIALTNSNTKQGGGKRKTMKKRIKKSLRIKTLRRY